MCNGIRLSQKESEVLPLDTACITANEINQVQREKFHTILFICGIWEGWSQGWRDGSVLKSLAVLAEDPGSVLSTHMVAHNFL